ncbi:MAG: hypothetical protein AMJ65_06840 [Phycisphaerae bacterium SG8_4]|nr:MAG: hypothetical protein AMJ65_06840 [Phycisphaerae bacterium SG8_4]
MPEPESRYPFREIGNSGLRRTRGYVQEEFLSDLQGTKAIRVYREMSSNDATIGALLFMVEMMVRQANWELRPYSEEQTDVDKATFTDECLHDMSHTFDDFLSECLSFLVYGWSYFEEVLKIRLGPDQSDPQYRSQYSDGRIGWRKWAPRPQSTLDRWEFDENGGVRGLWQAPANASELNATEVFIPIEKSLLFRTRSNKNNPEGESLLRRAYRAWYLKKKIEEIEGIGIERDLAGLPMMLVPPEILDADADDNARAVKQEMLDIVTNVRRDEQEGIMLAAVYDENNNPLYDFKLLTTGGRRQFDTDAIISRWDHRVAMSILGDFILLGHKNVGSFAMSKSKIHLFAVAMDGLLDMIQQVINRHAIPRLFKINGMPVDRLPMLVHGTVEEPDLEQLGEYIKNITGASVSLLDYDTQNYLRSVANMPENAVEAEELKMERASALVGEQPAVGGEELDDGTEE